MLTERPDIALGFPNTTKENVQNFWEEKKVWLDYKSYIKRKLSLNKTESRATGGGGNRMHTFTDIEKPVIRLTGLETSTSDIKGAQSFGVARCRSISEDNNTSVPETPVSPDIIDCSMESQPEEIPNVPRRGNVRGKEDSSPQALLQKQINMQKVFYKESAEFAKSLSLLSTANETIAQTQVEMLEEMRRHNRAMEELKREEINKIFMECRINN